MKAIKYLSMLGLLLFAATSCMSEFDTPNFEQPPFGNNEIGDANTTIAELKTKYASTISSSGAKQITDNCIIEGIVVANDITGNIYKQFVIDDGTGAMIIGVNDVGLYAMMPIGQKIIVDCKDLYIGGYGGTAQIGGLYEGEMGRMNKSVYPKHVKLVGKPGEFNNVTPTIVHENFFTDDVKNSLPLYVRLEGITIKEADGEMNWAPEDRVAFSNTVKNTTKIGSITLNILASTYADFAVEKIPEGELNVTGVLTRFNNDWQFIFSSTSDFEQVNE